MISREHQTRILQTLASQANERRMRKQKLTAIERELAQTMWLAQKHDLTWRQIGPAASMNWNSAYKWWRRQPRHTYLQRQSPSDPMLTDNF